MTLMKKCFNLINLLSAIITIGLFFYDNVLEIGQNKLVGNPGMYKFLIYFHTFSVSV